MGKVRLATVLILEGSEEPLYRRWWRVSVEPAVAGQMPALPLTLATDAGRLRWAESQRSGLRGRQWGHPEGQGPQHSRRAPAWTPAPSLKAQKAQLPVRFLAGALPHLPRPTPPSSPGAQAWPVHPALLPCPQPRFPIERTSAPTGSSGPLCAPPGTPAPHSCRLPKEACGTPRAH